MIYAVQPLTGGPVKIGCSADVPSRICQLEAHYGQPLALLATLPGESEEERAIHQRFGHLRLGSTEQFMPALDLMDFLDRPDLAVEDLGTIRMMLPAHLDPTRDDVAVKVDRAIVGKAKLVATHRGISVAELLSEAAKPAIDKAYAQMLRELEGTEQ